MIKEHSKPKAMILDMDGVLWRASRPIGDLPSIFSKIKSLGIRVLLATNNATLSRDDFLSKLRGYGVDLEAWQIVNSAEATAQFLKKKFPSGGSVFVVGESGLCHALMDAGFTHAEENALAVVAGMDRNLSYQKLGLAARHIRSGVLFIGTNPDRTYPTPEGLMPGAGSVLAFLQAASGVEPTIIGKPQAEMYKVALERLQTLPEETLIVGDRLETDILGAQAIGCQTAVVLSGVSDEAMARAWRPAVDYIIPDLTDLVLQFTKEAE
jgi:4-nitrophenyl phosphatase